MEWTSKTTGKTFRPFWFRFISHVSPRAPSSREIYEFYWIKYLILEQNRVVIERRWKISQRMTTTIQLSLIVHNCVGLFFFTCLSWEQIWVLSAWYVRVNLISSIDLLKTPPNRVAIGDYYNRIVLIRNRHSRKQLRVSNSCVNVVLIKRYIQKFSINSIALQSLADHAIVGTVFDSGVSTYPPTYVFTQRK